MVNGSFLWFDNDDEMTYMYFSTVNFVCFDNKMTYICYFIIVNYVHFVFDTRVQRESYKYTIDNCSVEIINTSFITCYNVSWRL